MSLKDKIGGNVDQINEPKKDIKEDTESLKFFISIKQEEKDKQVSFPINTLKSKRDALDKIAKRTKRSRNELLNMVIDIFLENHEIE